MTGFVRGRHCGVERRQAGQGNAEELQELGQDCVASSNTGSFPLFGEMHVSVRGQPERKKHRRL